jgi:hypothetical protein
MDSGLHLQGAGPDAKCCVGLGHKKKNKGKKKEKI